MVAKGRKLEVACFSVASALVAIQAGADRIELCAGPVSTGGLTPTKDDVERVKEAAGKIPVHVMIRPRAGDFVYTDEEIRLMVLAMQDLHDLVDGFVFGALSESGTINAKQCATLLSTAHGKASVFHRAVDESPTHEDYLHNLGSLLDLGFTGILTSGRSRTADEGCSTINEGVRKLGGEMHVIVGGGVRAASLTRLIQGTGAEWYHSSALVAGLAIADAHQIQQMLALLRSEPAQ